MITSSPSAPTLTITGPAAFAAAFGVSRETLARLETYQRLLRQWQKAVNLVAASTLEAVWQRHFADCAQLLSLAPTAQTWVDLGSGGGFPGLVVAIMLAPGADPSRQSLSQDQDAARDRGGRQIAMPAAAPASAGPDARLLRKLPMMRATPMLAGRVTLVESDTRKCAFLREVARQCGVAVDILSTRIESAATQSKLPAPDVVTARALAPLDKLLNLAAPVFCARTVGLFLKGREAASEVEAARRVWTFDSELIPSRTDPRAHIVRISRFEPNRKEPRS
jgi:16S rRNA (guanine527-N7)-methyltransferase